jgi:hypothetical protein
VNASRVRYFQQRKNSVLWLWSSISYGCAMTYPATTYVPVSSFSSAPRANYAYNYYKCYRDTRASFSGMGMTAVPHTCSKRAATSPAIIRYSWRVIDANTGSLS